MLTFPDALYISPRNAEISELFPDPTDPITAIKEPSLTRRFIFFSRGGVSMLLIHENDPFSIIKASSVTWVNGLFIKNSAIMYC